MSFPRVIRSGAAVLAGAGLLAVAGPALGVSSGEIDPSFTYGVDHGLYGMAVQPDGKVLIGGGEMQGGVPVHLQRLNPDGSVDTGFTAPAMDGNVVSLAVLPSGRILVGGTFAQVGGVERLGLVMLNADGSMVDSFDPAVSFAPHAAGQVRALAVQSDGRIIVGGWFDDVGGVTRHNVARINADGSLDTGFDPDANGALWGIVVQSDGGIVIGGSFTSVGSTARNRLARLNADGTLDGGYNPNLNGEVDSLALQPDGRVVAGGGFTQAGGAAHARVARVNVNGGVDAGFADPGFDNTAYRVMLQPDGRVLVGGAFTSSAAPSRVRLARLNADGTIDPGFAPEAPDYGVNPMGILPDGRIMIGGDFTSLGSATHLRVARLFGIAPIAAPTNVIAAPLEGAARVSWTAIPGSISSYDVTASPGGRMCTAFAPATTCDVGLLTPGTAYTFTVTGSNQFGRGPSSGPSAAITPPVPAATGTASPIGAAAGGTMPAGPAMRVRASRVAPDGDVVTTLLVAGPARVSQRGAFSSARASSQAVAVGSTACVATPRTVTGTQAVTMTCHLSAQARRAHGARALRVRVVTTAVADAGPASTVVRVVRIPRAGAVRVSG